MGQTDGIDVNPPTPSITPQSGYSTSSGQMVSIFTIICAVLALAGFHYTPDQLNSWVAVVEHLSTTFLPLITGAIALVGYVFARSNVHVAGMNATAQVQVASMTPPDTNTGTILGTAASFGGFGDSLTGIIGGHDWKDPERYENLLHVAASFGVPGAAQANKIDQQIHPVDLITGILGAIHHGKKP